MGDIERRRIQPGVLTVSFRLDWGTALSASVKNFTLSQIDPDPYRIKPASGLFGFHPPALAQPSGAESGPRARRGAGRSADPGVAQRARLKRRGMGRGSPGFFIPQ